MPEDNVIIFDTTLRDGEQAAGAAMTLEEKVEIAKQLERLRVDVIEAGFAASSPGDFQAVQAIAREVRTPTICSLSRCVTEDVDSAAEALKDAAHPRIHVFLSSSDIQILHQLRKNREEVMEMAVAAVERAKRYCDDVEFSPMDATRTQPEYLYQLLEATIAAGATTVNIPDTVGYAIPEEFARLLVDIQRNVPNISKAVLSVHCHNDLGLSVSNSLAAVKVGARQVEGCINGIGERAGNASLEEVIMSLSTRKDYFGADIGIDTTQLYRTSRLVSDITGFAVQSNKAIVGQNAFRHASGIHQDGVLKERTTFEIMDPRSVGIPSNTLVLGKLSGRAGLRARLEELGYHLTQEDLNSVFQEFKDLADKKREVNDRDLEALMSDHRRSEVEICRLDHVPGLLRRPRHRHGHGSHHRPGRPCPHRRRHGHRPRGRGLRRNQPDTPGSQHPPGVLHWLYHGGHGRPWRGDHQDSAGRQDLHRPGILHRHHSRQRQGLRQRPEQAYGDRGHPGVNRSHQIAGAQALPCPTVVSLRRGRFANRPLLASMRRRG